MSEYKKRQEEALKKIRVKLGYIDDGQDALPHAMTSKHVDALAWSLASLEAKGSGHPCRRSSRRCGFGMVRHEVGVLRPSAVLLLDLAIAELSSHHDGTPLVSWSPCFGQALSVDYPETETVNRQASVLTQRRHNLRRQCCSKGIFRNCSNRPT